ncbi:probable ubiquitin-conjugating enzyme E2 W-B isoform X2 [Chiloscyllium plagiosum]|uniref:probable ubiquitin-conjugating enzyme E2 W-B isoform X2 n=1 Tax=Chiloscyllium plagiosum TaxID=36176 RepID=UPI001CB86FA4|nr:probable ubiquitin-conjugating enzyme E2 W-B isoform X2 [Chiloscyllium plagiosum]
MASMQKRLQKELMALQNDPPPGMTLNEKSVQNSITQWIVDMEGAPGTLYEGEKFQLLFKFSGRYPFDSPQVIFTGDNIPVHPHVYSNGHICLSILTEDWSPALSVQSVCLSIISMLSSCKEKVWIQPIIISEKASPFSFQEGNPREKLAAWHLLISAVSEGGRDVFSFNGYYFCCSIQTHSWFWASGYNQKRRPPDNSFYVRTCNKNPKKTKWWYHDDTC